MENAWDHPGNASSAPRTLRLKLKRRTGGRTSNEAITSTADLAMFFMAIFLQKH
jgi:hypothetical protein